MSSGFEQKRCALQPAKVVAEIKTNIIAPIARTR